MRGRAHHDIMVGDGSGRQPLYENIPMDKNALDRSVQYNPEPLTGHELFFGPPPNSKKTGMTSGWQSRGDWPMAYLGENNIYTSQLIWVLEEISNMNSWVQTIAPMIFTNNINFTVTTKIFSNDGADLIGLSAPPSEVSSYIQQHSSSGMYIGKSMSMNANMLSSKEGQEEMWEKLMAITNAIMNTELMDFILEIRQQKFAELESQKMKSINSPDEYFDMEKADWDISRKMKNGMQAMISNMVTVSSGYRGELDTLIVPRKLDELMRRKSEYTDYYINGPQTTSYRMKLDKNLLPAKRNPKPGAKPALKINGFNVFEIREVISTTRNLYQDILRKCVQIGTFSLLFNKVDEEMECPNNFTSSNMQIKMYDEDTDNDKIIPFSACLDNSFTFHSKSGKVRQIMENNQGVDKDKEYDPFLLISNKDGENMVGEPIKLIGQMNIRDRAHYNLWPKLMKYCGETMLNHFNGGFVSSADIQDFVRMFTDLENIPYDVNVLTKFLRTNWKVYQKDVIGAGLPMYQEDPEDDGDEDDDGDIPMMDDYDDYECQYDDDEKVIEEVVTNTGPAYTSDRFYGLEQSPGTGFYKFSIEDGKVTIPFGCANLWAVEAIANLDIKLMHEGRDKFIHKTAVKFVKAFDMHARYLENALPDFQIISNIRRFSPIVFQTPKASYNAYINTMHNATNFLWVKYNPFGLLVTDKDRSDSSVIDFFKGLSTNTKSVMKTGVFWTADSVPADRRVDVESISTYVGYMIGHISDYNDDDNTNVLAALQNDGLIIDNGSVIMTLMNDDTVDGDVSGERITVAMMHSLFNAAYTGEIMDSNVFNSHGLYKFLLDQDQLASRPMGERAFTQQIRDRNPQKMRELDAMRNLYLIYSNARKMALTMASATGQLAVRTTLTLSPQLRYSISGSVGNGELFQTKYTPTGVTKEQAVAIGQSDKRGCHTRAFDGSCKVFYPFHVWRNFNLYGQGGQSINFMKNETLSPQNTSHPSFGETFSKTMREIGRDPFTRSATAALLMADMTSNNMKALHKMKACPPIEYIIFRPHMEYLGYPVIGIMSKGRAAFRIRGNPLLLMGMAAKRGVITIRYTQSMGTVVTQPKNIFVQENAIIDRYVVGSGGKFFSPKTHIKDKEYYNPAAHKFGSNREALFAVEVPVGFSRTVSQNVDILGHFTTLINKGWPQQEILDGAPQYPTAYRFANFWNIPMTIGDAQDNRWTGANTLCCQDRTLYRVGDTWKPLTLANSHWGNEATGPTMKAYRGGALPEPKKADW